MKESALTSKIVKALRERGAWAQKIHGGTYNRGVPDILGCYHGMFFAMEVKVPGRERTVTEIQGHTLESIQAADGYAWVVTTVTQARDCLSKLDGATRYKEPHSNG